MEQVDWSSLHKILGDTTRRSILDLLKEKDAISYTEIMAILKVTNTGRLNYHLKALNGLISKDDQGMYHLTERGQLAVNLLQTFPEKASKEKKHQSTLKMVAAALLILVGILLIASALGSFAFAPITSVSTDQAGISNQVIPQNTTVSLLSWNIQSASPLNITWSASSIISIYIQNSTQHDALLLQHTTNGEVSVALTNFTGVPTAYITQYDLQAGSVSLNLPQGQYYFLASSSIQAIVDSFSLTQQQGSTVASETSASYLLALVPLALGIFMLVLAILILTHRVWR
ncbi:MAG: winged helix-turn-helix domain-containing protein [Candidatus Bathyarchaeia archaeon]|jgi:DNA-binding transcriptional ArsR family regulator